jgi:hypothetical protein
MRWNRFFRTLILFLTVTLLPGTIRPTSGSANSHPDGLSFEELRARTRDPQAAHSFTRALEAVSPDRLAWLETTLWQRVRLPGLSFQAEGRLLHAPEGRFRLELSVGSAARLQVSDGTNLWTARRDDSGGKWVDIKHQERPGSRPVEIPDDPPQDPAPPPSADLLTGGAIPGVYSQLMGLQGRVEWITQEARPDGSLRLTGVTRRTEPREPVRSTLSIKGPPATKPPPEPTAVPRICRLVLAPTTLWPVRIEWYGPMPGHSDDALMVEMEYRAPILNRPLSPAVCAREFSPHSEGTIVTDVVVPPRGEK